MAAYRQDREGCPAPGGLLAQVEEGNWTDFYVEVGKRGEGDMQ